MTLEEKIRRYDLATAADDLIPASGVLGNPVTFAARWGLPLSRAYLASDPNAPKPKPRSRASRKKKA